MQGKVFNNKKRGLYQIMAREEVWSGIVLTRGELKITVPSYCITEEGYLRKKVNSLLKEPYTNMDKLQKIGIKVEFLKRA